MLILEQFNRLILLQIYIEQETQQCLPLIKNVVKPLAKSALIPLGLTATAASAADARIHKKILGSGTTTLIILNDEMEDIIKIVKSLEDSGLLLKRS